MEIGYLITRPLPLIAIFGRRRWEGCSFSAYFDRMIDGQSNGRG